MQTRVRTLIVAAAFLSSIPAARAQNAPPDPSGHWQGAIHIPNQEIAIEIDLAKKANGDAVATFTGVSIKGFPLSDIVFDGASVTFKLKVDGGGAFSAKVSADGKSMAGEFTTNKGGYTVPFDLARIGDATFDPPARSPKIGRELEGTWTGILEANGVPMRLSLTMANQPDGMATGWMAVLDQGAVDIPVSTISQTASGVNIAVNVVNGSFSGTLNAAGTELAGTWSQGTFAAPLTFQKQ